MIMRTLMRALTNARTYRVACMGEYSHCKGTFKRAEPDIGFSTEGHASDDPLGETTSIRRPEQSPRLRSLLQIRIELIEPLRLQPNRELTLPADSHKYALQ